MSKQEWEIVEDGWGGYYVRENSARREGSYLVERLVADGIQSEANAKLIASAPELLEELKNLHRNYVNLLEAGRDRIVALGGDCDPVDRMEQDDPHLRAAKAVIAKATA